MAATNHSTVQSPAPPTPQADVADAMPPAAPANAPAGPAQAPANLAHGVQVHLPQNVATPDHPVAETAPEPMGAAVDAPPLPLGVALSPLSRSLYGWLFRN
ncbi:hypothetical protein RSOL_223890, partial [Rhizoctonia solani AG-3 Rhs1AP]